MLKQRDFDSKLTLPEQFRFQTLPEVEKPLDAKNYEAFLLLLFRKERKDGEIIPISLEERIKRFLRKIKVGEQFQQALRRYFEHEVAALITSNREQVRAKIIAPLFSLQKEFISLVKKILHEEKKVPEELVEKEEHALLAVLMKENVLLAMIRDFQSWLLLQRDILISLIKKSIVEGNIDSNLFQKIAQAEIKSVLLERLQHDLQQYFDFETVEKTIADQLRRLRKQFGTTSKTIAPADLQKIRKKIITSATLYEKKIQEADTLFEKAQAFRLREKYQALSSMIGEQGDLTIDDLRRLTMQDGLTPDEQQQFGITETLDLYVQATEGKARTYEKVLQEELHNFRNTVKQILATGMQLSQAPLPHFPLTITTTDRLFVQDSDWNTSSAASGITRIYIDLQQLRNLVIRHLEVLGQKMSTDGQQYLQAGYPYNLVIAFLLAQIKQQILASVSEDSALKNAYAELYIYFWGQFFTPEQQQEKIYWQNFLSAPKSDIYSTTDTYLVQDPWKIFDLFIAKETQIVQQLPSLERLEQFQQVIADIQTSLSHVFIEPVVFTDSLENTEQEKTQWFFIKHVARSTWQERNWQALKNHCVLRNNFLNQIFANDCSHLMLALFIHLGDRVLGQTTIDAIFKYIVGVEIDRKVNTNIN